MKIAIIVLVVLVVAAIIFVSREVYFVESAFKRTPAGNIEIKTIPESRVLMSETQGNYYSTRNLLFRRLFDYISDNRVSMTVPVGFAGEFRTRSRAFPTCGASISAVGKKFVEAWTGSSTARAPARWT